MKRCHLPRPRPKSNIEFLSHTLAVRTRRLRNYRDFIAIYTRSVRIMIAKSLLKGFWYLSRNTFWKSMIFQRNHKKINDFSKKSQKINDFSKKSQKDQWFVKEIMENSMKFNRSNWKIKEILKKSMKSCRNPLKTKEKSMKYMETYNKHATPCHARPYFSWFWLHKPYLKHENATNARPFGQGAYRNTAEATVTLLKLP